jgi:hypothetical protein
MDKSSRTDYCVVDDRKRLGCDTVSFGRCTNSYRYLFLLTLDRYSYHIVADRIPESRNKVVIQNNFKDMARAEYRYSAGRISSIEIGAGKLTAVSSILA